MLHSKFGQGINDIKKISMKNEYNITAYTIYGTATVRTNNYEDVIKYR